MNTIKSTRFSEGKEVLKPVLHKIFSFLKKILSCFKPELQTGEEKLSVFLQEGTLFLTLFLTFILVFSSLLFLCRSSLNCWIMFLSWGCAAGLSAWRLSLKGLCRKHIGIFLAAATALSALLFASGSLVFDSSYDGRTYHQSAVYLMMKGWNPFYETSFEYLKTLGENPLLGSDWADTYVKFFELAAANIYLVTGSIEAGKSVLFLLGTAAFFYTWNFFLRKNLSCLPALLLALALTANPVAACQFFTYYVDGASYYSFLLLFLGLLSFHSGLDKKTSLVIILSSALLLSNIKTLGLFYSALLPGGYFLFLLFQKDFKAVRKFFALGSLLLLLCALCGFNPYFTNLKKGNHIFHPLLGKNKIDIMTYNTPLEIIHENRLYKFIFSMASVTTGGHLPGSFPDRKVQKDLLVLKIPFLPRSQDMSCGYPDYRLGGFGWFGSGIFLLGAVFFFLFLKSASPLKKEFMLFSALLLLTVILNPEAWWARYIPQLWILPFLSLGYFFCGKTWRSCSLNNQSAFVLLCALALINFGILLFPGIEKHYIYKQELAKIASNFEKSTKPPLVVFDHGGISGSVFALRDQGIPCQVQALSELKKIQKQYNKSSALSGCLYFWNQK